MSGRARHKSRHSRKKPSARRDGAEPRDGRTDPAPRLVRRGRVLSWFVILVAAVVAAYANSLDAPFILDDLMNKRDPAIKPPLSAAEILAAYRPVVTASLALNYALGELRVTGYHVLNLVAHIACGILFFGFARYTLAQPVFQGRYRASGEYVALFAAAVFLLHPIQTESVTYPHQRSEIFVSIALLAGLWTASVAARGAPWRHVLPALTGIGIFGLLSKESFVALAPLFALYDWCFIAEGRLKTMVRRWRLYSVLGAISFAVIIRAWGPMTTGETSGFHLEGLGSWRYLTWQFGVLLYYVRLILIPDRLCFDCGYFGPWPVLHSTLAGMVWTPAFVLAGGGVAAWLVRVRFPLVTFGIWGSAIVLAVTSSIVPLADVYVEHRLYLPIGLTALSIAALAFSVSEWALWKRWLGLRVRQLIQLGGAVLLCGVLASLTVARNELFGDPIRLLQDSVAKAPENRRAQFNLGNLYYRAGQFEEAIEHYLEAIHQKPDYAQAHVNLGNSYLKLKRYSEAAEAYESAQEWAPDLPLLQRNLANIYRILERIPEAIAASERAVALAPGNARGHKMLADLYARTGRVDEALREYREVARLNPRDSEARRQIEALVAQSQ